MIGVDELLVSLPQVDEPERLIGRSGKIGRQKVSANLPATVLNDALLGFEIGSEIGELVGIERVADAQCDHCVSPDVGDPSVRWPRIPEVSASIASAKTEALAKSDGV
jgi:hypothetical protein